MPPTALALIYENQQEITGEVSRVDEIETGAAQLEQLEAKCVTALGPAQGTAIMRTADIDALPTVTKIIRVTLTRDTKPFRSTLKEATVLGLENELHDSRTGACGCESYHISTSTATTTSITASTVFITSLQYKSRPTPQTPKSHIARASPPTFFHPRHPTPRQLPNSPPKLPPHNGNGTPESLTTLSIAILALALLVMAVGAAWVVVVYWVNFPPTWLIGRETKTDTAHCDGRRRRWGWRGWFGSGSLFGRARRLLDKPSKYARLGSASSIEYESDGEADGRRNGGERDGDVERAAGMATGNGTESAMSTGTLFTQPLFSNGSVIELRERKGKTAQHARSSSERLRGVAPPEPGTADTSSSSSSSTPKGHRSTISLPSFQPPSTDSATQPPPCPPSTSPASPASPASPHNPLLPSPRPNPSLYHRNSATWLRDREAFISSLQPPSEPIPTSVPTSSPHQRSPRPTVSPHTSTHSLSPRCSFDSVSDLESQSQCSQADGRKSSTQLRGGYVALLNGRRGNGNGNGNGAGKRCVDGSGNGSGHGNARAWLEAVDGAVNRVVDRMVRWTDDRDGEEGLLLPVAEL